jgi:CheY-like chemotaxis protein
MNTLLVLEDESAVMKLLRYMLKPYGVVEAASAEQALRLFADHGRQIDLLIADVTLPVSSGIQVALLLRSELPRLPVILMSGYPMSGWTMRDSADLAKLGTASVTILEKPFQSQVLSNTVRELLETVQVRKGERGTSEGGAMHGRAVA